MVTKHKIPLRQFYRNIEELIINKESDSAISNASYLLEKYPKNIAVHQLLGKALLDMQEFGAAHSVFKMILNVNPDDFISHFGLSLIAEDFGDLEKALVHMKRAYELQPSNESLQTEVRRLHELKDGYSPEKIRLTRGALIKMYSRSRLAEQGISEAKLGIQENPERTDFKIHMAEMQYYSGKKIEAIETSLEVLKSLPYCKSALSILYKSVKPLENAYDSSLYQDRLTEIDPYYAFIKHETNSVEDIPDIAIMIEPGEDPEASINKIIDDIELSWREAPPIREPNVAEETDWSSIVEDAALNEGIGKPISDAKFERVHLPKDFREDIPDLPEGSFKPISKKDKLRSKLTGSQKGPIDDEPIPEWIFEEELDEQKKEEEVLEKKNKWAIDLTPQKIGVQPDTFGEDGMTDHDTPINPMIDEESDFQPLPTSWEKGDIADRDQIQLSSVKVIDDTQRIKVIPENPEDLLLQMKTSIKENNFAFSYRCLDRLIERKFLLDNVADELEVLCKENPDEIELWLYLVKAYKFTGKEEIALSTLKRAQKSITL